MAQVADRGAGVQVQARVRADAGRRAQDKGALGVVELAQQLAGGPAALDAVGARVKPTGPQVESAHGMDVGQDVPAAVLFQQGVGQRGPAFGQSGQPGGIP